MAGLGDGSGDRITIRGYDLADELIGKLTFAEMLHLLAFGSKPEPAIAIMLDAILVTLADHGLTPSAIAARLTIHGAPESQQGAVAAGLLGAGSALLGTTEQVAEMLSGIVTSSTKADRKTYVESRVTSWLAAGTTIPGFGHPIHRGGDRRVDALRAIQLEHQLPDEHFQTAQLLGSALSKAKGRSIPMNAAGAIGAIVSDCGLPPSFARSLSLVARSAGLVAHLIDEARHPLADHVWTLVREDIAKT